MLHSHRPKAQRIGLSLVVLVLLVAGGSAFWFGLRAFRAHADVQSQKMVLNHEDDLASASLLQSLPATAIISSSGGADAGRATRVIHEGIATIDVLVTLPAIESSAYAYHVWLVKDGLADVVDVGALTPRADGTFSGVFTAGPVTGVIDAALFSELVIMLEPRDGNAAPSGMKVGRGEW